MADIEDHLLSVNQVDQEDLEKQLIAQANSDLAEHENELDSKRLAKTEQALSKLQSHIAVLQRRLNDPRTRISLREQYREELNRLEKNELAQLIQDRKDINERIRNRSQATANEDDINQLADASASSTGRLTNESEHDFLVRTGKITPFAGTNEAAQGDIDLTMDHSEDNHQELIKPAAQFDNLENDSDSESYVMPDKDELRRDDGIRGDFRVRVRKWERLRAKHADCIEEDVIIDKTDGFRIPGDVWKRLFGYQRTGVRWLWELFSQKVGGIVGDEMGLGKTVQVAAFLAGLHHSGLLKNPAIIVCPATVMDQWVAELHQWWPPLRVAILHSIGTAMGNKRIQIDKFNDSDSDLEDEEPNSGNPFASTASKKRAANLIASIFETGGVIVTTYSGAKIYETLLNQRTWGYACLDEGHKIRNPDSEISLACKQLKTPYRLILSGTPIQNNLTELWSLFDFIFPGRLGTLPVFQSQFSVPINIGGYANATNIQVQTAYKCAVVLRDMIAPYMLRRMKTDVAADLPKKTEKVLFCKLTKPQKQQYVQFLKGDEMNSILKGKRQVLFGVDILRKICNHPDLILQDHKAEDYGDPVKSGKMQVVAALLELWKSQGNRALLFSQTRQMLDILESMMNDMNLKYMRMDGSTAISQRQRLVDTYNNDTTYQVFLLTTKVGGLGVNLTGANRVIIYDPDWNPSTDVQARERAWRLGQKSEVMIYRLMIAGSIEEKIYQRQIFKQFLTNKILKDPKQKRFFKTTELHDLFTLGSGTESADMFGDRGLPPPATSDSDAVEKSREQSQSPQGDDLSTLQGVSKESNFQAASEDSEGGNNAVKQEDSLLQGLFAKAGVQSTLEHDAVIDASRPDTVIMEKEAQRIAHQATMALKESRKETRKSKIGTPTWTGKSGLAGRLKRKRENKDNSGSTLKSSAILQGLRQKKALQSNSNMSAPNQAISKHAKMIESMQTYLKSRSPQHSATSAEIVDACKITLEGPQDVSNLRQSLRQIANWTDKKWVLKTDI